MDLERVREFAVFAESLKFAEAAQRLSMSQSSLSRHIQAMEQELGVVLVNRGDAAVPNALTRAGRRYLELALPLVERHDEVVAQCRELQAQVPPARIQQDIRYVTNVSRQLRGLLERSGTNYGGRFSFVSVNLPILQALDQGLYDFAFHAEPLLDPAAPPHPSFPDPYGCIALDPEPLCFLVGVSSPLASRAALTLKDVAASRVITIESSGYTSWMAATERLFAEKGCPLTFDVVADNPFEGGAFPIGTNEVVLCTKHYVRYYESLDVEDVQMLPIEGFNPVICPFLVYRRDMASVVGRQIVRAAALSR